MFIYKSLMHLTVELGREGCWLEGRHADLAAQGVQWCLRQRVAQDLLWRHCTVRMSAAKAIAARVKRLIIMARLSALPSLDLEIQPGNSCNVHGTLLYAGPGPSQLQVSTMCTSAKKTPAHGLDLRDVDVCRGTP